MNEDSQQVKRNPSEVLDFVKSTMLPKGATESDIDEYVASEGYSFEDIQYAQNRKELKFGIEELKGAKNISELPDIEGQTIGGIALPLAAAITAPATGGASLVGLAALGGAGGEAWEQIYNHWAKPEKAPKQPLEAATAILKAGGEEAAYEVTGQVVNKIVGKGYHILKPKMAAGIEELQKTFEKYGGSFTAAERTNSFLTQSLDALTRGSLTGKGIMKTADDINDAALKRWQSELSDQIAESAAKNMTDEEFGLLIKNTIKGGKGAFQTRMGKLYSSFDDLVMTRIEKDMVEKVIKSPVLDESGKELSSKVISEVSREIRPVDLRPFKKEARDLSERLARVNYIGVADFGGKTIQDILGLDDAARFSDAHNLRSSLLDISRAIKNKPEERKLYGSIARFTSKITEAMDKAALAQGDDAFIAYKKIQREASKGYGTFNDEIISSVLSDKTSSVKVGEMIYRDGNVDQIRALRKSLNRAAKYNKEIDAKKVWEQTQQKYLETVFHSMTKSVEMEAGETLAQFQARSGTVDAAKLGMALQNPQQVRTMNEMLGVKQRELIHEFAVAAGITQAKQVAGLGMLIQLTQAGAIVGAISGRQGAVKMLATTVLPMEYLAKMMTNPITARMMVSAAKTPIGTKEAVKLTSKIMIAYENAKAEEEGEKKTIEKVLEYGEKRLQAL